MGPEHIMTPTTPFDKSVLRAALDDIIRTHGLWPVARAFLASALKGRPRSLADPPISDHIRRDIGLRPMATFDPWNPHRR